MSELNNVWACAIDLDGTLLTDDSKITEFSKSFLSEKWDKKIIVVTGRNMRDSIKIIEELNLDQQRKGDYLVYNDGSDIIRFGEQITHIKLPPLTRSDIDRIQQFALREGLDYALYFDNYSIEVINSCSGLAYFFRKSLFQVLDLVCRKPVGKIVCGSAINHISNGKCIKIGINGFGKQSITNVYKKFLDLYNDQYYAVMNDGMIEIKHTEANKLAAMKKIISLEKQNENIIYFGNAGNDLACLSYFSNSFAIKDSNEKVLNAASYITEYDNNNDGVVRTLIFYQGEKNVSD